MTQSTNARPCNCDQALKAEAAVDALNATCAAQGRKLAAIEKLLLARLNNPLGPVLRGMVFEDPTLERIRLAMLERPW